MHKENVVLNQTQSTKNDTEDCGKEIIFYLPRDYIKGANIESDGAIEGLIRTLSYYKQWLSNYINAHGSKVTSSRVEADYKQWLSAYITALGYKIAFCWIDTNDIITCSDSELYKSMQSDYYTYIKEGGSVTPDLVITEMVLSNIRCENLYKSNKELNDIIWLMAKSISEDYSNLDLLMLCFLPSGYKFFSDLMSEIKIPCDISFITIDHKYDTDTDSLLAQIISRDHTNDLFKDKDVLFVDVLSNSGRLYNMLRMFYLEQGARSVKTAVLFEYEDVELHCEYVGEKIKSSVNLVGYGIGSNRYLNNRDYILKIS